MSGLRRSVALLSCFSCPWVSCPEVEKSKTAKERGLVSTASCQAPKFRRRPTDDWNCSLVCFVLQVLL